MHIETYPLTHYENSVSESDAEQARAAAQRLGLPQQEAAITHAMDGGPIRFGKMTPAQLQTCLVVVPKATPMEAYPELIPPRVLDLVNDAVAQDAEGEQQWGYFVLHTIGLSPMVPVRVMVRVPEQDVSAFGWSMPNRVQLVALWVVAGTSDALVIDTMDPWSSLQHHAREMLADRLQLQATLLVRRATALLEASVSLADLFVKGAIRNSHPVLLASVDSIAGPNHFTVIKDL